MNTGKLLALAVIVLAALGGVYFYMSMPEQPPMVTNVQPPAPQAEETAKHQSETAPAPAGLDVQKALSERILGNPAAPIKISEHSSFTCGHCGKFHKLSFKQVKAELIDTGKAYLVFSDFPLNAPALHASMISRCLPQHERYFDFVQMLFEEQENWAYEASYLNILKQKAEGYGLDEAGFKACLESKELQDGIVARAKAAQTQWQVSSTPSFVVNNKTLIGGALPPGEFIDKVKAAVTAMSAPESINEDIEPAGSPPEEAEDGSAPETP